MKKTLIIIACAFITLSSCTKDASSLQNDQVSSIGNNSATNSAADPTMQHIRVDLTGFKFRNDCSNEDLLILSGVYSLNTHQNGNVASYNVHNFVLQASDGTIYRGTWVGTFTLVSSEMGASTVTNTYKVIMTTPGGSNNFLLRGVFHVTTNANGENTVVIDNFTAGCQ